MTTPTEPTTEAGRALVEWAENAYPGQDQVRIWREHAIAIEAEARASAPLDYATLVAAIDESGLIDRLRDYFREAHPDGFDAGRGSLLNEWSTKIAAEYARLTTEGEKPSDDPISDSRQPEDGPPPGRWPR